MNIETKLFGNIFTQKCGVLSEKAKIPATSVVLFSKFQYFLILVRFLLKGCGIKRIEDENVRI